MPYNPLLRFALCCLLLCSSLLLASSTAAQIEPEIDSLLQEILEDHHTSSGVVGVTMAVSLPSQGTWMGASGLANRDAATSMSPTNLFRVASITKTFVAATVLQLTEEGVLSLDDALEKWLPGLVPNGDNITIRHLLSHSSGLFNYTQDDDYINGVFEEDEPIWTPEQIVDIALTHPPTFAPGTNSSYSNTGYILLGMVVETATQGTIAQEIRRRFLKPLHLENTYFDGLEQVPGGPLHGYDPRQSSLDVGELSYASITAAQWAAGAMVSTVSDLAKWAEALYGGQVLQSASLTDMLTNGLGVQSRLTPLGRAVGHEGITPGFSSLMFYLPERKIAVVILENDMVDPNGLFGTTVQKMWQTPAILTHLIEAYPEDLLVLEDLLGDGLHVETTGGATPPELTANGPVYQGETAGAFQVQPEGFLGWKVNFNFDHPIGDPLGYAVLRFAFHPGTATGRSLQVTLGGKTASLLGRNRLEGIGVDLEAKDWQLVEIPLATLLPNVSIESIGLSGDLEGTFYLDDIRLIALDPPPSATAVFEEQSATRPISIILDQNYPNPFNSGTVIRFELPADMQIDLALYNLAGQKVATLVNRHHAAGLYTLSWDGRDDQGRELATGIYLYRLEADDRVEMRKLLLVH